MRYLKAGKIRPADPIVSNEARLRSLKKIKTHPQGFVPACHQLGKEVPGLRQGRVGAYGPLETLLHRPRQRQVALAGLRQGRPQGRERLGGLAHLRQQRGPGNGSKERL